MTSLYYSTFLDTSDDQLNNADSTVKSVLPDGKQAEKKCAKQLTILLSLREPNETFEDFENNEVLSSFTLHWVHSLDQVRPLYIGYI